MSDTYYTATTPDRKWWLSRNGRARTVRHAFWLEDKGDILWYASQVPIPLTEIATITISYESLKPSMCDNRHIDNELT